MRELKLTQGYKAFVDDDDYKKINQYKWHIIKGPKSVYARSRMLINGEYELITLHRFLMGLSKGGVSHVDHINGNGLDNRKDNLRYCTHAQNVRNAKSYGLSSKYKGVMRKKNAKRWEAQIHTNNKKYYLGLFKTEVEAAKAYNDAAIKYHGEFARLNKI